MDQPSHEDEPASRPPGSVQDVDRSKPGDRFPRDEALALVRRLPAYGRLAWRVGRDPELPIVRRGAVLGAAAYLLSPIDAIPGIVPLIGQLDDVLVVMVALRFALAGLSAERRQRHLAGVGLSEEVLTADLRTLAGIGAWAARTGARASLRASRSGLRMVTRNADRLRDLAAMGSDRLGSVGSSGSERLRVIGSVAGRHVRGALRGDG